MIVVFSKEREQRRLVAKQRHLEAQSGKAQTLYIYGGTDSVSDAVKDNCAKAAGIKE